MSKYKFKDAMESDDVRVSIKYRRFLLVFWIPVLTVVSFTNTSNYSEYTIPYRKTKDFLPYIIKENL